MIKRLKSHVYKANTRTTLKNFGVGMGVFMVGAGMIVWADRYAPPSLEQEIATFVGTLIAGSGFLLAIYAHLILILHRIFRFLDD